ncbi:MAG TPA: hypothetical protein VM409_06085 [Chloroflexia bacterium]|nr:hypothetical protein [Chloroflexia bacterium]
MQQSRIAPALQSAIGGEIVFCGLALFAGAAGQVLLLAGAHAAGSLLLLLALALGALAWKSNNSTTHFSRTPISFPHRRGWMPFRLQVRLHNHERVKLFAREGTGVANEVPTELLWPDLPGSGLAVTVAARDVEHRVDPFAGSSIGSAWAAGGEQALLERDPAFAALAPADQALSSITWEGEIYSDGGTYEMELRTDGRARMLLDGVEVLDTGVAAAAWDAVSPQGAYILLRGGFPSARASTNMDQGWHRVRLELQATGRTNGLEWSWTGPNGTREIVPPSRLRHQPGSWPAP